MAERIFRLAIPGKPVAWARPRTGRQGQFFNTAKSTGHRDKIGWLAKQALHGGMYLGPVQVNLIFDFGRNPQTIIEVKPVSPESGCHAARPDLSNCIKLVEDALAGIVFADDKQICRLEAVKVKEGKA